MSDESSHPLLSSDRVRDQPEYLGPVHDNDSYRAHHVFPRRTISPIPEEELTARPAPGVRPSKNFFITIPQCDESPESAIAGLTKYFGDQLTQAVVVREAHKDGNFHLHASVSLKMARYLPTTVTDIAFGHHGKVEVRRYRRIDSMLDDYLNILDARDLRSYCMFCCDKENCDVLFVVQDLMNTSDPDDDDSDYTE